jgi:hypothetical protein
MPFLEKFTDDHFLGTLDTETAMTTSYVAKWVGCSRNTANTYLNRLVKEDKVRKVGISGGFYAWVRCVDTDVKVEEPREPTFEELFARFVSDADDYLSKHPEDDDARKLLMSIAPYDLPYEVGDYIAYDHPNFKEDLEFAFVEYPGVFVYQLTRVYRHVLYASPIGISKYLGGDQRITNKFPSRIATKEEIDETLNFIVPEISIKIMERGISESKRKKLKSRLKKGEKLEDIDMDLEDGGED